MRGFNKKYLNLGIKRRGQTANKQPDLLFLHIQLWYESLAIGSFARIGMVTGLIDHVDLFSTALITICPKEAVANFT